MKLLWIPILSALLLSGCSAFNGEQNRPLASQVVGPDGFTQTQRYQIMAWLIKSHENYTEDIYECKGGKPTVGWGFNCEATGIWDVDDIRDADDKFKTLLDEAYKNVDKQFPNLTYLQKAVVVSMVYNAGLGGISNSKLADKLKDGDMRGAVKQMRRWIHVKNKRTGRYEVSKGLVNRRELEIRLLTGKFTMDDYNRLKSIVSKIYTQNGKDRS